jgi:hypothetical protein
MISPKAVKEAEELLRKRTRIATARWLSIVDARDAPSWASHPNVELAYKGLLGAIEEFRKRKLAEIEVRLRELGVDLSAAND